jgi:plasmid stability protein
MAQVLIRNIDEETVESYRQKARIKGVSLEQELRNLLEANRPFTPAERVAVSRDLRSRQVGVAPSMTLDEIREGLA